MTQANVYDAPKSDLENTQPNQPEKDNLITIAKRQKALINTSAFYFIVNALYITMAPELKPIVKLIGVVNFFIMIVLNIRLCWRLYGPIGKTIMTILSFVPIINFIAIWVASSRVNRTLKKAGVKVGFMGAKIKDI